MIKIKIERREPAIKETLVDEVTTEAGRRYRVKTWSWKGGTEYVLLERESWFGGLAIITRRKPKFDRVRSPNVEEVRIMANAVKHL